MTFTLRRAAVGLVLAVLLAAGAWLLLARHDSGSSLTQRLAARRAALAECLRERAKEAGREREAQHEQECPGAPESTEDIARINAEVGVRIGPDTRGGVGRAMAQRAGIARPAAAGGGPGSGGTWAPYGKGPLLVADATSPNAFGDGFGHVNGRINGFTYVAQTNRLYAAVAQGGLWESADLGKTW